MQLDPHHDFVQALVRCGWIRSEQPLAEPLQGDLLPAIVAASFDEHASHEKLPRRLAEHQQQGTELRLIGTDEATARWLGPRLLWHPRGRPRGQRIGVISSRLGRSLDSRSAWFAVLRAACAKIDRQRDMLLTATSTTTERFLREAAELFDVPVLCIEAAENHEPLSEWLERVVDCSAESCRFRKAYLSPVLAQEQADVVDEAFASRPLADRAIVALSDRLLVFHLRRRGQLIKLVQSRLKDDAWPTTSTFVALGPGLVSRTIADELLSQGAVGWVVMRESNASSDSSCPQAREASGLIVPPPRCSPWSLLTHATRAQSQGWPDQDETSYLRELILESPDRDHSAFAAIRRIVEQQRIIATSRITRGDTPIVSFTAVPLDQLHSLRTYRSHLGRWDFDPYGVCVPRAWLEARGARRVTYGDDRLWQSLSNDERPFFQTAQSRYKKSGRVVDWTVEREWRHVGDVDLQTLSASEGLVFVPTREEAEQLAAISRWPVTILSHARHLQ